MQKEADLYNREMSRNYNLILDNLFIINYLQIKTETYKGKKEATLSQEVSVLC